MPAAPRVAVVVPVFNKLAHTVRFLESFREVRYPAYQMIIVDDGSTDDTAKTLARRFPEVVRLQGDGNLWWSGGTNLGVCYALENGFDYVLTINNDTLVSPHFLRYLVETAETNPRAIVGARINMLEEQTKVWALGGYMDWRHGKIFQLYDHADLDVTTDYRRVLSELVTKRLGNPNLAAVFPGYAGYTPLNLFAGADPTAPPPAPAGPYRQFLPFLNTSDCG